MKYFTWYIFVRSLSLNHILSPWNPSRLLRRSDHTTTYSKPNWPGAADWATACHPSGSAPVPDSRNKHGAHSKPVWATPWRWISNEKKRHDSVSSRLWPRHGRPPRTPSPSRPPGSRPRPMTSTAFRSTTKTTATSVWMKLLQADRQPMPWWRRERRFSMRWMTVTARRPCGPGRRERPKARFKRWRSRAWMRKCAARRTSSRWRRVRTNAEHGNRQRSRSRRRPLVEKCTWIRRRKRRRTFMSWNEKRNRRSLAAAQKFYSGSFFLSPPLFQTSFPVMSEAFAGVRSEFFLSTRSSLLTETGGLLCHASFSFFSSRSFIFKTATLLTFNGHCESSHEWHDCIFFLAESNHLGMGCVYLTLFPSSKHANCGVYCIVPRCSVTVAPPS